MSSSDLFIRINSLPQELRQELLDFLDFLTRKRQRAGEDKEPRARGGVPGLAKGRIEVLPGFDDPLDDFKPYME